MMIPQTEVGKPKIRFFRAVYWITDRAGWTRSHPPPKRVCEKRLEVLSASSFAETLIHTVALARWTRLTQNQRNRFNGFFRRAKKIAARRKPLKRFQTSVRCDIAGLKPRRE